MENQNLVKPTPQKSKNRVVLLVVLTAVLVAVLVILQKQLPLDTKTSKKDSKIPEIQELNPNQALNLVPTFLLTGAELKPVSAYEFTNNAGDKQVVVKLEAIKATKPDSILQFYESAIKAQKDWVYISSTKAEGLTAILAEKQDRSQGLKITLFPQEKAKPLEVELLLTFPKNLPQIKK